MKNIVRFITGLVIAIGVTVGLELIFAIIVQNTGISSQGVRWVNQGIKLVCILLLAFLTVTNKGIIYGGIQGFCYGLITNLLFGIISGSLSVDTAFFLDLLFTTLIGGICGILVSNLKTK